MEERRSGTYHFLKKNGFLIGKADRSDWPRGRLVLPCLASISTVLEMTNGAADLGKADDKLLVAEPRHGCWGVGKF